MNPIGERLLWFVLGLGVGWLSGWLVFGFARRKPAAAAQQVATPPAPSTTVPARIPEMVSGSPEAVASSRIIDVGAARAAGFNMKHADDLTVIEGIGPKIEELFRANGVGSLVQIACLGIDDMLDILERGGPSFRLANPDSWAQQASLAAENRWKDLKRMQDDMIGSGAPDSA